MMVMVHVLLNWVYHRWRPEPKEQNLA